MLSTSRGRPRTRMMLLASAAALATASAAWAQDAGPVSTVEEVTVTAQKRAENVQDVPLSVTPLTSASIERLHVQDFRDVTATVPNVQIQVNAGLQHSASLVIRGIGIAANPSPYVGTEVGTVIDGVVQSTNRLGLTDHFDVERIEILRGPQGTLFGANTTGGVINVIMRQPTGEYGSYGRITLGNHDRLDAAAAVNFPIVEDVLAGKVSVSHRSRDGFYTNLYNGEDIGHLNSTKLRGYLLWTPSNGARVTLSSEVQRIRNGTDVLHNISYPGEVFYRPDTPRGFRIYSDVPDVSHAETFSTTLTAEWDTPIGEVTSITNYSKWKALGYQDIDGIDLYGYAQMGREEGWQQSQELRTVFHPVEQVEVLLGGFVQLWGYHSRGQGWAAFVSPTNVGETYARQRTENLAAFTQVYWDVTDRLRLQGGLRVSREKVRFYRANIDYVQPAGTDPAKGFGNIVGAIQLPIDPLNAPSSGEESWTNIGGKVGADYRITDDVMAYGYYARGFKSGGFNGRVSRSEDIGPYDPEFVDSFEIGFKSDLLDRRLRLNVAAFLNKWKDMQVSQVLYRGNPPVASATILNAAEATTKGFEVETEIIPFDGFRINASAGYLKAEYDDFRSGEGDPCPPLPAPQPAGCANDFSGRDLVYSPKWNASVTGTYTFAVAGGEANATVQYTYNGKRWGNYTQAPSERLPSVSLVNANLSWTPPDGRWTVAVWARNLFDKRYLSMALDAPPLFTEGIYGNPREFGVDFSFDF